MSEKIPFIEKEWFDKVLQSAYFGQGNRDRSLERSRTESKFMEL